MMRASTRELASLERLGRRVSAVRFSRRRAHAHPREPAAAGGDETTGRQPRQGSVAAFRSGAITTLRTYEGLAGRPDVEVWEGWGVGASTHSRAPRMSFAGSLQRVELRALEPAVGEAQVRIVAEADDALGVAAQCHCRQERGRDSVNVAD